MARVIITGFNDDLIEVDGDISEEFNALDGDDENGSLVAFSDGTLLRIVYPRSGVWRITPVAAGTAELTIEQAPEDDADNYSDKATVVGDVAWVAHGINWAKAKD